MSVNLDLKESGLQQQQLLIVPIFQFNGKNWLRGTQTLHLLANLYKNNAVLWEELAERYPDTTFIGKLV